MKDKKAIVGQIWLLNCVQFQKGSDKVVIELWVIQFWFEITVMISYQIALHSVQLPLFIPQLL